MWRPATIRHAATALLLMGALAAPVLAANYTLFQLSSAICYGIGILGLKLLSGYNGQFSLGHSAFFATGAYVAVVLSDAGWNYYLTIPVAAAGTFILGLLLGWPALRIRGHHLALVTFLLALAAPQLARSSLLTPFTGGSLGTGMPRPAPPIAGVSADLWWYGLSLVAALLLLAFAVAITRGRFGRAMQASRDHPRAARAMGMDVALVNTTAFGISASYAGIAGALMMGPLAYVGPDSFTSLVAIGLFIGVLLTGLRWLAGSFIGGLVIVFLPIWTEDLAQNLTATKHLTWGAFGIALLAIVYAMAIDWRRVWQRVGGKR